jgi:predicted MFS family arabinose efflux permease
VWVLGAILTVTMAAASFFQFAIASLSPDLVSDVGLSHLGLGMIPALYYLSAAGTSFMLGRKVDTVSSATGTLVLYLASATAFLVAGIMAEAWALLGAAVIAGAAAGLSNPVTNRMITGARDGAQGPLVGIKQAGVQLAVFAAGVGMPALALLVKWRGAMVLAAVALVLLGGVFWLTLSNNRHEAPRQPVRHGALPPLIRWLSAYALLMGAGMSAVTIYIVLYGHEKVGLSTSGAALLLSAVGLTGAAARIVSSIVAARGDRLGHWMTAAACVAAAGVALCAWSTQSALLYLGAATIGLSGAAWNGIAVLAVLRTCPDLSSQATGLVFGGFFIGLAMAPPAFGVILDVSGSYSLAWTATASCFACAALAVMTGTRRHPLPRPRSLPPESG